MRRFTSYGPAIVVLGVSVATLAVVPAAIRAIGGATTKARVELARQSLDVGPNSSVLEQLNAATRSIADSVEPSVVHLDIASERLRGSSGSGWIYDDSGHIVTTAHVVSGARMIRVQFFNGRTVEAKVVGSDPLTDIAVVKVAEIDELVAARRATGERVQRGDRVFAFGSPFGFKFSMSEGIVSGLGRSARAAMGGAGLSNFIQTDAAVNPGNSGGPLVDVKGRVVGMNVAIATAQESQGSTEGQSAGISFAIPLATIESRVEQLIAGGPIKSGFLGIRFRNASLGGPDGEPIGKDGRDGRGVAIEEAIPSGPASKAGLRDGDVIASINGEIIPDSEVMRATIAAMRPGQRVELRVWRANGDKQTGGEYLTFTVELTEKPQDAQMTDYRLGLIERAGLVLAPPVVRGEDTDVATQPIVTGVIPNSLAAEAGINRGDRIVAVEGKKIATIDETVQAIVAAGFFTGSPVAITLRNMDGEERDVELAPE